VRDEADGTSKDSSDQHQRRFEESLSRLLTVTKQEAGTLLEAERRRTREKRVERATTTEATDRGDKADE
jgi:hypothetical protein